MTFYNIGAVSATFNNMKWNATKSDAKPSTLEQRRGRILTI